MADDTEADETQPDEVQADQTQSDQAQLDRTAPDAADGPAQRQPARRPTAAASAASRARRIGGARATPGPASAAGPQTADEVAQSPAAPVPTQKTRTSTAPASTPVTGSTPDAADTGEQGRGAAEVPAWLRWVPAGVLTVCAVTMLVLILIVGHSVWYAKPSGSAVRDRVLAAAKTCISATNTYDYQSIPQDEKKGLACATGKYSGQYRTAIKNVVTPAATKLKASQSVQINKAGIENISTDGHEWTVLLYGQTKISQTGAKTRVDPFSAEAIMQEVSGKWLIKKINTIVSPDS